MKLTLTIFLTIFLSTSSLASPQMPDYFIFKNDTFTTYNLLVEMYLQKKDSSELNRMFGLSFRGEVYSSSCWRNYQAIYRIENDSLFLVEMIECGELRSSKIDRLKSQERMRRIFASQFNNNKVFIDWYDGSLSIPNNNNLIRWDGVFYKIFEKEKVFSISQGKLIKVEDVLNYIDDPKRIDRRNRYIFSDLMFKKIKKANWKKETKYDCSNVYWIIIDKTGKVSSIKMNYYDDEFDLSKNDTRFNYCTNKIYNQLKDLRFDIICDKGQPIEEEIYLEIWQEKNGKIKNWTQ